MKARHAFSVALALAGCAASGSYVYWPQGGTYGTEGYPSTITRIPSDNPTGSVELTSFGVVEIKPDGYAPIRVLHARLTVTNEADTAAWTVTTRDLLAEIAGEGRSRPIYVNTDTSFLPSVSIGPREVRRIDLYYPLPRYIENADDLPAFDLIWQLTTPAQTFASRTRFQLFEHDPPATYRRVVYYTGWGPYWWYDPLYYNVAFIHHHPVFVHRPTRVFVTRPPVGHYRATRDHRR